MDQYLQTIDRLLWQRAWWAYRRLPSAAKVWISEQDLYQEAALEAIRCLGDPNLPWNPKRGSKNTFVYACVQNRMTSILAYWSAKRRLSGTLVELEEVDREKHPFWEPLPVVDAMLLLSL